MWAPPGRSKLIEKQDLLLIFRSPFTVILILVRFPVQPFTQLAPPAVHHGLIPVLAEVLCNIILVGVKVDDNDALLKEEPAKASNNKMAVQ